MKTSIRTAATENLLATYRHLGTAIGGTRYYQAEGFNYCLGPFPHPICNFACELTLDPWSTRRLLELARSTKGFQVYVLPGDEPDHVEELLTRNGFAPGYELIQMLASPTSPYDCDVVCARGNDARVAIARFMSDQFFASQTNSFRRTVSDATANAEAMELYGLHQQGSMTGAVMLSHSTAVLGLYNLCVASSRRSRGFGGELVKWVLGEGYRRGVDVTLQCDERLVPWYESLGFHPIGRISVYSLSKVQHTDIMNLS